MGHDVCLRVAVTKRLDQVRAGAAEMKKQWLTFLISSVLTGPMLAHAVLLVDTGPPTINNNYSWVFADYNYFAAEFTIASSYTINSIEGYISNDGFLAQTGTVLAEIYRDGGECSRGSPVLVSIHARWPRTD
jgi:hypothetical protein